MNATLAIAGTFRLWAVSSSPPRVRSPERLTQSNRASCQPESAISTDQENISHDFQLLGEDLAAGSSSATLDASSPTTDVTTLQSDAQTAQPHLPPASVPGLRGDYSAGLAAYATSATEIQQGLKDLSAGSDSAAQAHFDNAGSAMNEGTARSRPPPAEHERAASKQDQLAARSGRTLGTSRRT